MFPKYVPHVRGSCDCCVLFYSLCAHSDVRRDQLIYFIKDENINLDINISPAR